MDVVRVDQLFSDAIEAQLREQEALRATMSQLGRTVEELAGQVAALRAERATQMEGLAAELRAALDGLSTVLRRDLARIPQVQADHREAIAADMRAALAEALAQQAVARFGTAGLGTAPPPEPPSLIAL